MLTFALEDLFQMSTLYIKLEVNVAHMTLFFVPGGEMFIITALSSGSKCTSGGPI